jgi:hypothetical protein
MALAWLVEIIQVTIGPFPHLSDVMLHVEIQVPIRTVVPAKRVKELSKVDATAE